jgi:transglycosylase-like protein with SLT domain
MGAAVAAGQVIVYDPRARRWGARAAAIAAALIATPIVVLLAALATLTGSSSAGTVGAVGGIPAVYAPMYQAAAAAYHVDPYVLAALHETESDYSRDPSAFAANSAGAIGPMQFLPSTWAAYRSAYRPIASQRPSSYPHVCAPHGCITDDYDSIAAAADYLHQLGADAGLDQRTLGALISYKGTPPASIPYARQTFALAQQLEAANVTSAGSVVQAPSGPLLARLVTVADEIAAAHIPYCYGGGHTTPARPSHGTYCHNATGQFVSGVSYDGLDCSSAVSMLLQASGVNTPTLDSTAFMSFGTAGPGRRFTIWANPAHVFVSIHGRGWGTNDANPYGGPGWALHTTVGFTPRHLPGL